VTRKPRKPTMGAVHVIEAGAAKAAVPMVDTYSGALGKLL
jgi:hypothetical protein